MNSEIKFITNAREYNPENTFTVHLPEIRNKEELFSSVSLKLGFPSYFGFNWDALSECLRDLSWISFKKVNLIHDDIFLTNDGNSLTIYIDVLKDALQDWQNSEAHDFDVFFPVEMKRFL